MMKLLQALALVAAAALMPLSTASAQTASSLERILKDKKIRITAEVTSPPFGVIDQAGQPDGSEIATSRQLAKDLGVELELVQVPGPQRIPALLSRRADVAISSLSITIDRSKTVMFANPHGALSVVIAAPQAQAIRSAADLAGKRVGLTRATLEEAEVPKVAPADAKLVYFDDAAATFQALISGQVDAVGLSAFAARSIAAANPGRNIEAKFVVKTAYYAAAVRYGEGDLLRFLNTWIFLRTQDGTLGQIYEKYTGVKLVPLPTF